MIKHPRRLRAAMQAFCYLENRLNYDDYRYLLRSLYRIVQHSQKFHESKETLIQRIQQFERDCLLPALLSSLPLENFLEALEQMQYLYPICSHEVSFFLVASDVSTLRRLR